MIRIRRLCASDSATYTDALAGILVDCVRGGASVSFMADLSQPQAQTFFESCFASAARGERILLGAFDDEQLVGTVQIVTATPPNQPHRADVAKLLVRRSARGQGIGELLMREAENAAAEAGKSLLVLDTVTGDSAERLYARLGWTRAGVIPDYALYPNGNLCATTIFWKRVSVKKPYPSGQDVPSRVTAHSENPQKA